ncbi:MAG: hypothetical protein ACYDAE_08310 [Steroidobacteraceae bacterium]
MKNSREILHGQRSHIILVLSSPREGAEELFRSWYLGPYREAVLQLPDVLCGQQYEPHELDVSNGRYPGLPYRYLGLYELSLDGAPAAAQTLARIAELHRAEKSATAPATWLYYPASERVGRSRGVAPSLLTIAFANPVIRREMEFREWYATCHIRHALDIPQLVSGQCFELTQFQNPGAAEPCYSMIAIYELEGAPQDMLASMAALPPGRLHFPAMDLSRFAECVYRPLPNRRGEMLQK